MGAMALMAELPRAIPADPELHQPPKPPMDWEAFLSSMVKDHYYELEGENHAKCLRRRAKRDGYTVQIWNSPEHVLLARLIAKPKMG